MVEEILWDLSVFPTNKINKEDVWEPIYLLLIKAKKLELLHNTTNSKLSGHMSKGGSAGTWKAGWRDYWWLGCLG